MPVIENPNKFFIDMVVQPRVVNFDINPINFLMEDAIANGEPIRKKKIEIKPDNYIPTLRDYIRQPYVDMFGFELEVEGRNLPDAPSHWMSKHDGSLRGESNEYILNNPENIDEVSLSLDRLIKSLTKPSTVLNFSFRTSIHVHLNVLAFTKAQIHSLFYLSHLVEDVLVRYSGESRVGNRFCLRTKDADWKIRRFKNWLTKSGFDRLNPEDLKYSAINIATITSYGSMEFRSLRGTVDKEVIIPWLSVIKNLYDIAAIVPVREIEELVRTSPIELLNVVFKEHLPLFSYTNMEQDVNEAVDRLIEIPYVKVSV